MDTRYYRTDIAYRSTTVLDGAFSALARTTSKASALRSTQETGSKEHPADPMTHAHRTSHSKLKPTKKRPPGQKKKPIKRKRKHMSMFGVLKTPRGCVVVDGGIAHPPGADVWYEEGNRR